MKNQKTLTALLLGGAILAAVFALPKAGHADGLSIHAGGVGVSVNDGDGDHDHRRHHDHHHWLHHEQMDAALASLRDARSHLDKGGNDFGGHRVRAIRAADNAIREIQDAVDYANSHER
ncbi:MAG TPA: hypothetical protein VH309_09605 [Elusimicrobiota bacterium]|jgi:ABC-type Zn uptake system ZnuABC Zn-binding protein ZnuA|nr:hypothetical protein [Elusimicrobiota bacterium]